MSGFPHQRVGTIGEQLLIPLIHLILLCFLPFGLMRWTRMTGAAAGCGQFFITTKHAYELSGGHSAIRQSLHDGIMLPRAYRMRWPDDGSVRCFGSGELPDVHFLR